MLSVCKPALNNSLLFVEQMLVSKPVKFRGCPNVLYKRIQSMKSQAITVFSWSWWWSHSGGCCSVVDV